MLGCLAMLLVGCLALPCQQTKHAAGPPVNPRPYHMGFTLWPADISLEGVKMAEDFAYAHGDIVSVMFIGGVPWPEALDGKPYSEDIKNRLKYRTPVGKKLFLSISPLDMTRKDLAEYWGTKDNLPLPSDWKGRALDSPEVMRAYRKWVFDCVESMNPDYLAIGIELNVLLTNDASKWPALRTLYTSTYRAVKKAHPHLPVFFTTEVLHYKGLSDKANANLQSTKVKELMADSDMLALSLYPHMNPSIPQPMSGDFLDFAKGFGKPIAISESGMSSADVTLNAYGVTLRGSEDHQNTFVQRILDVAQRDRYRFVINYATTDFEKLCKKLPSPIDDLARIWSRTGLQGENGEPKQALKSWDTAYGRPVGQ